MRDEDGIEAGQMPRLKWFVSTHIHCDPCFSADCAEHVVPPREGCIAIVVIQHNHSDSWKCERRPQVR
jgi:hypothetical protein